MFSKDHLNIDSQESKEQIIQDQDKIIEVESLPVCSFVRGEPIFSAFTVKSNGLTLGKKVKMIDNGEYIFYGLLPRQQLSEDRFVCLVDYMEMNKVWRILKQR